MDNAQSAEVRETLLKVLTGDDVGRTVLHTLQQLGLIRRRESAPKRVNLDWWYTDPSTNYELTPKGLRRIQGD